MFVIQVFRRVANSRVAGRDEKISCTFLWHVRQWAEAPSSKGPLQSLSCEIFPTRQQQEGKGKPDHMLLEGLVDRRWRYELFLYNVKGMPCNFFFQNVKNFYSLMSRYINPFFKLCLCLVLNHYNYSKYLYSDCFIMSRTHAVKLIARMPSLLYVAFNSLVMCHLYLFYAIGPL